MEKELAEIRKEIIEARNLVIKNDNLLKNLGSDLKVMAKKQESFERKQWISSAVAYAVFAALAATAGILGAQGYVAQARSEIASLTTQAEEATESARIAREELNAAREASRAALAAYQKLDASGAAEREKAAAALVAVDRTKISKLEARALDDRGREIIQQLANEKMEAGKQAFRRSDWAGTVANLTKALELWPDHPQADEHAFYLGNAASQSRQWELAAENLQRFVDKAAGRTNKDFAYLLLGQAYDQLGRKDRAEEVLREGINGYPASQFNKSMRGLLSRIRKTQTAGAE